MPQKSVLRLSGQPNGDREAELPLQPEVDQLALSLHQLLHRSRDVIALASQLGTQISLVGTAGAAEAVLRANGTQRSSYAVLRGIRVGAGTTQIEVDFPAWRKRVIVTLEEDLLPPDAGDREHFADFL